MIERSRNKKGKFVSKSDEYRKVRSIRLTDSTWDKLRQLASKENITVADLIEKTIADDVIHGYEVLTKRIKELEGNGRSQQLELELHPKPEVDLEVLRDKALKLLKVGEQSKSYKAAKKAFDWFIKQLSNQS